MGILLHLLEIQLAFLARGHEVIDEILDDERINAIMVHSKSRDMVPHTVRALAAGKSVVVEKPGGGTVDDLIQLGDAEAEITYAADDGDHQRHDRRKDRALDEEAANPHVSCGPGREGVWSPCLIPAPSRSA